MTRMLVQKDYKPGDMPPEGYLAWHEWADVQRKAGIKQKQCFSCSLWKKPQELSGKTGGFKGKTKRGKHAITPKTFYLIAHIRFSRRGTFWPATQLCDV